LLRIMAGVDKEYDGEARPQPGIKTVHLEFGDLDAGFREADLVREDVFFYEGNTHLPMEQHAAVAHFAPDGKLTLWSSTQTPHYVHRALAKTMQMPAAHVRVIATPNGGGFGGKSDPFNHEIVVAELSRRTRRPVKVTLTREEVFYCHRGRHPVLMKSRIGVKRDGSITALDFHSFLDGGAYGSYGVASTFYTGALQTVTYDVPGVTPLRRARGSVTVIVCRVGSLSGP
ncbi:MAG TPA: molybdopterin cofactor-binding domain-containing protein, partial [Rhodothermales bacterium]|nr:molybdopterin cofactor-binding domain-containing protein [Rhodothermales bacterium]